MRAVLLSLLLAACGSTVPAKCPKAIAPEFLGAATDDVYEVLAGAEAAFVTDDSQAFVLSEPTESQRFQAIAAAPTFRWQKAARHLPPITGEIFLLRTTLPNGCRYDVTTTAREWALDDAQWATIAGAKGRVTVELVRAYVQENRITEGPFRATKARSFLVE